MSHLLHTETVAEIKQMQQVIANKATAFKNVSPSFQSFLATLYYLFFHLKLITGIMNRPQLSHISVQDVVTEIFSSQPK